MIGGVTFHKGGGGVTPFYKITKIVCVLLLTEGSVCMRVCKHFVFTRKLEILVTNLRP